MQWPIASIAVVVFGFCLDASVEAQDAKKTVPHAKPGTPKLDPKHVDPKHGLMSNTKSHPFGLENTWSHHYPYLLNQAGMKVLYQHNLQINDTHWQLVIAGN